MPPFNQGGPRLQFPLKSQAKRHALSSNVLDSCNGERRVKPFESRANGAVERNANENGGRVGPLSMQERLRLAAGSPPPGPSNISSRIADAEITGGGKEKPHVGAKESSKKANGAVLGQALQPADCQPILVSTHPDFPGPGMGLENLGNTCYMNSVLQCLLHTPPLHNLLHERHHTRHCELADSGWNAGFCPMCLLEKRLRCSFYEPSRKFPRPVAFAKNLHHFAPQLRVGEQEDAHELLRLVIDSCHRTCLLQQRGVPLTALKKFEDRTGKVPTVMSDIFGGVLQSQVKCLSCGAESNKRDVFMDLSLDLSSSTHSVAAALHAFVAPEKLDGSNKYRCEKCKRLSPARKQMQVLKAPNVLVVQLKRFEDVRGGKITRHIHFHEQLNLGDVMAPASREPSPEYTLYSLIVHEGYSQQMGHYYALSRVNHSWYLFNDADVRPVSWNDVARRGAYILFYQKTRPRGAVYFYPPTSQGPVKAEVPQPKAEVAGPSGASGAQARPVIGPQLPPGYRGPAKADAQQQTAEAVGASSAPGPQTGPVIGPQLPVGHRSPLKADAKQAKGELAGRAGGTEARAGPANGPQLPDVYRGRVSAQGQQLQAEAAGTVGAPVVQTGPVYGPQLPAGYEGLVKMESEARAPEGKETSLVDFDPAGPVVAAPGREILGALESTAIEVMGSRIPSTSGGPMVFTACSQITPIDKGDSATAALAGPLYGPQLPVDLGGSTATGSQSAEAVSWGGSGLPGSLAGPQNGVAESTGLINGAVDSNRVENEMNRVPARPSPPDFPRLLEGPVSQAVTVEGTPRTERKAPITRPRNAISTEPRNEKSGLESLTYPIVSQRNERIGYAVESFRGTAAVVAGQSTGANSGRINGHVAAAGAAVERPPLDLKRRLPDAAAVAEPQPKRRLSDARGREPGPMCGKELDGCGDLGDRDNACGPCRALDRGDVSSGVDSSANQGGNLLGDGRGADRAVDERWTAAGLPRGETGLGRQGQGGAEVPLTAADGPRLDCSANSTGDLRSKRNDGSPTILQVERDGIARDGATAGGNGAFVSRLPPGVEERVQQRIAELRAEQATERVGGSGAFVSCLPPKLEERVQQRIAELRAEQATERVSEPLTGSDVPVRLSEGPAPAKACVSGRVELLVDAAAWSLAGAYSSDEDECAVLLRRDPKPDSKSPCNGILGSKEKPSVEGLGVSVGTHPGLVEAEALLRQGEQWGVFGSRSL